MATTWSPHNSLGQIVNEIVNEWSKTPPTPQNLAPQQPFNAGTPINNNSPSNNSNNNSTVIQTNSNKLNESKSNNSNKNNSLLQIPTHFDFLDGLTIAELEELDNNSELLQDYIAELDTVKSAENIKNELYQGLTDLANNNLKQKAEFDQLKANLQQLNQQTSQQQTELQQLQIKQSNILNRYSVNILAEKLQSLIDADEEVSEKLRENYYNEHEAGETERAKSVSEDSSMHKSHQKFVDIYVKNRQILHERAAKRERLIENFH
jgi:hypothetical protein